MKPGYEAKRASMKEGEQVHMELDIQLALSIFRFVPILLPCVKILSSEDNELGEEMVKEKIKKHNFVAMFPLALLPACAWAAVAQQEHLSVNV